MTGHAPKGPTHPSCSQVGCQAQALLDGWPESLAPLGKVLAPVEPTEEITDAIYEAETHGATSPEVYRAIIAVLQGGGQ